MKLEMRCARRGRCARRSVRLLVVVAALLCAYTSVRTVAAVDAMGAALEQDAADAHAHAHRSASPNTAPVAAVQHTLATEPAHVDALPAREKATAVNVRDSGAALHDTRKRTAVDDKSLAPPKLGAELSPEQLAAIGVTTPVATRAAVRSADSKSPLQPLASADAVTSSEPKEPAVAAPAATIDEKKQDTDAVAPRTDTPSESPQAAANVSIDHVEAHLQILQQLELSVAQSIEEMNVKLDARPSRRSGESRRISKELLVLKSNLKKLAESLNGTLSELVVVEKDSEQKSKKLQEVLEQQREDEQEQFIEENGMKVVDYETGHIRNTTGLSSMKLQKLEAAEKKVDPAVLHYDFELLGQIAILLGVAAIGGIIATYVNVPPNVGYLLGGALVGPSCLGLVRQFKEVETLSLFGSIFLLFGHGAGYTPQKLDDQFKQYFVGGMAYITSIVTLVAMVAVYIGWSASFGEGLIIGVAVCFTTTAPLYEYIRANQIHESSYGRTLTAIIAVQDVLMSFALGTPEWFSSRSVGWIGVAALRSVVSYGVVVALAYALHAFVVPRLLHFLVEMEQVHHSPLVLLGVVSVCLLLALFTESMGLSLECGAFLAGLAFVNVSSDAKAAFTSIRVMENLFGSMFFACVGMILNPMFLLKNAVEILSMVALIVLIKTLSMTAVMTFFAVKMEKALLAAVGLCQIGELALIFMIKAHATKLVSRRIYLLFVGAIAVFLGCSSIFNRQVLLARRKTVFRLPSILRRAPSDEHKRSMDETPGRLVTDVDDQRDAFATTPRRKSTKPLQ